MSVRALHSAASGMDAHLFKLDVVANNLANAGTTAFKRSRVNFEDLFYEQFKLPGAQDSQGAFTPTGIEVGLGTRVKSTSLDLRAGGLIETQGELDVAIAGDGFFQVQDGAEILYTRDGSFSLNANGQLVLMSADRGRLVEPAITIPQDVESITITGEGRVVVKQQGQTALNEVGQLQLARFINPQGLLQRGENLYAATDASGAPLTDVPGQQGLGTLKQGFLEASNVEPVRELVELIKTQRNVELNSQVLQAADQLLQLIANIRRF